MERGMEDEEEIYNPAGWVGQAEGMAEMEVSV